MPLRACACACVCMCVCACVRVRVSFPGRSAGAAIALLLTSRVWCSVGVLFVWGHLVFRTQKLGRDGTGPGGGGAAGGRSRRASLGESITRAKRLERPGFEPGAFCLQSERDTTTPPPAASGTELEGRKQPCSIPWSGQQRFRISTKLVPDGT